MSSERFDEVDFEMHEIEFSAFQRQWEIVGQDEEDMRTDAGICVGFTTASMASFAMAAFRGGVERPRYVTVLSNPENQELFFRGTGYAIAAFAVVALATTVQKYRKIREFKKSYEWSD